MTSYIHVWHNYDRLYTHTNNITYFNISKDYFNHAMSIVPERQESADFLTSQIGLWTVGAIINDLELKLNSNCNYANSANMNPSNDKYIKLIQSTLRDISNAIMNNKKYSPQYHINIESGPLFGGLSGALYTGLLINNYFDNKTLINPNIIS